MAAFVRARHDGSRELRSFVHFLVFRIVPKLFLGIMTKSGLTVCAHGVVEKCVAHIGLVCLVVCHFCYLLAGQTAGVILFWSENWPILSLQVKVVELLINKT
jgi:hypothetical protein